MQRFYVTFPLTIDLELTDTDIVHQLTRVMRAVPGNDIVLFDGDGSEYTYTITHITKKSVSLKGKGRSFPKTEGDRYITLYQALPNKMEKIEYILEKGVEVGVKRFVFFRSEHSQKLVLSENKKARFLSIAREALEQCGGMVMPEIEFFEGTAIEATPGRVIEPNQTQHIVLDTTGTLLKLTKMPPNREIGIWVGPEGGWSENERKKMKENGFIFARFGERVLRTETAGVVMAFALEHL